MSLASRRRLMIKNTKAEEPVIDWSLSVLPHDTNIPFPYNERPYAFNFRQGNLMRSSNDPFYILKTTRRDYKLITTEPNYIGIKSFSAIPAEVDTSDLGFGEWYWWDKTTDFSNFGGCNYPVYEVRYNDDHTKLIVVR